MKLIKDDDNITEVMQRLEKAKSTKMKFGILGSGLGGGVHKGKEGKGKLTVVEIGSVHEFGAPRVGIPERSFMRKTFDERQNEIESTVNEFFGNYIVGDISFESATNGIGEFVKGYIQTTIRDLSSPPLKAATIELKRSSQPLIDSGQLLDSIEYEVE